MTHVAFSRVLDTKVPGKHRYRAEAGVDDTRLCYSHVATEDAAKEEATRMEGAYAEVAASLNADES